MTSRPAGLRAKYGHSKRKPSSYDGSETWPAKRSPGSESSFQARQCPNTPTVPMAEMVPSEIASDVSCARCGGDLQVRYCSFDLDLPVVALCVVCLYGPEGILTAHPDRIEEDRSAGRWCDICQRHGGHHTDRHPERQRPMDMADAIVLAIRHATDAREWSVGEFLASLRHDGFYVAHIDGSSHGTMIHER